MSFADKSKKVFKFIQKHWDAPVQTQHHNSFTPYKPVNSVMNNSQRGIYVDATTGKPVSYTQSNHLGASPFIGNYSGNEQYNGKIGNSLIGKDNKTDINSYTANSSSVRFVPEDQMVAKGYGSYNSFLPDDLNNENKN